MFPAGSFLAPYITFLYYLPNSEDEVEEAERLTTRRPTVAEQSTENPSARDKTGPLYRYRSQELQKSRDESSVKKSIANNIVENDDKLKDIKLLDDILTRRLYRISQNIDSENTASSRNNENSGKFDEKNLMNNDKRKSIKLLENVLARKSLESKTSDSENKPNSRNLKDGLSDKFNEKVIHDNIDKSNNRLQGIKILEQVLARRSHQRKTVKSEKAENSRDINGGHSSELEPHLRASSKNLGKEAMRAMDIKLLELILKQHGIPKNSETSKIFQKTAKDRSEKDSQNLPTGYKNRNGSEAFMENPSKKNENASIALHSNPGKDVDNEIRLKTIHEGTDETIEIADSSSKASESLNSVKNDDISKANDEILDKPVGFTSKNILDTSGTTLQPNNSNRKTTLAALDSKFSLKQKSKDLAAADKLILDELYRKKKMEDAGSTSYVLSGGDHTGGKNILNVGRVMDLAGNSNANSDLKSREGVNSGDPDDMYKKNNNTSENNYKDKLIINLDTANNNIDTPTATVASKIINKNNNNNNNKSYDNATNTLENPSSNNTLLNIPLNSIKGSSSQSNNLDASKNKSRENSVSNNILLNTQMNNEKSNSATTSNTLDNPSSNDMLLNAPQNNIKSSSNHRNNPNPSNSNSLGNSVSNNMLLNTQINNKNSNNNNGANNNNNNNNLFKVHAKNESKTPSSAISSAPKSNRPPQNKTVQYNLEQAKAGVELTKTGSTDAKLAVHNKQAMKTKFSSNAKLNNNQNANIQGKIMPLEEYLAKSNAVLLEDPDKIANNSTFDDYDSSLVESASENPKVFHGNKMIPDNEKVMVSTETGKSLPTTGGHSVPVIQSSDPNFEISP